MSVRYARLNDMFREIDVARGEGRVYDALGRFSKPDLLILDDFFTTPIENPLNAVDPLRDIESRAKAAARRCSPRSSSPTIVLRRSNSGAVADSILRPGPWGHARVLDIKGPNVRGLQADLEAEMEKGYSGLTSVSV